jgi:hypothetical protein
LRIVSNKDIIYNQDLGISFLKCRDKGGDGQRHARRFAWHISPQRFRQRIGQDVIEAETRLKSSANDSKVINTRSFSCVGAIKKISVDMKLDSEARISGVFRESSQFRGFQPQCIIFQSNFFDFDLESRLRTFRNKISMNPRD